MAQGLTSTIPSAVPSIPPATVFYLPEIHIGPAKYFRETNLGDARKWQVVADIASAEIEDVKRVIGFDVASGKCWDASKEIANDVLNQVLDERGEIPDWCRDFLESHLGVRTVISAEREAA